MFDGDFAAAPPNRALAVATPAYAVHGVAGGVVKAAESTMGDRRRALPPIAGLVVLLCATSLVGALALLGGWSLGAVLWGDADASGAAGPLASLPLLGGGPGALSALAQPQATATPAATPTPEPPPTPVPVLATRRLVTYYGNPYTDALGVLGEQPRDRMIARLRQQATAYQADGRPVQPALHLIATVAQAASGDDGMYRFRMPPEMIDEWANLAEENGFLLILDVQVGRSSVQEEVEVLRPFLEREHVHLALDPEFAMSATTMPGRQIGSIAAEDINWAINYLADIAVTHRFENRVLIVHQFTDDMIQHKDAIELNDFVDLAVMMDGFGGPTLKISQYRRYITDDPLEYAGIKLFYKQDHPLMSPADVLALDPVPDVVTYQ
ncbi:MAG TPA: hypothetical protein VK066_14890 [Chloroflexota bacterium]|nr:hypothetical protein [Chloroflexota bacterium]